MPSLLLNESVKNIFSIEKKCIINTDLDGMISGMLLQKFLKWKVVGFSCCCGKPDDELWLFDTKEDLNECVFVDLPVCVEDIPVIDQHFVLFDKSSISKYNGPRNKINPNVMRERLFKNERGYCEYTKKYPFGTAHFILAVLENLGYITPDYKIDFDKKLGNFDLADLILRADRVIGNTFSYTPNCLDWSDWIIDIGGNNTRRLFTSVKSEYKERHNREQYVEAKMLSLGCGGIDGDCSNLFRAKDYTKLNVYFSYLSDVLGMEKIPLNRFIDLGNLHGRRFFELNTYNRQFDLVKNETMKDNVFSFAFVTMKTLSLTYKED